jgi:hypothetical protein
MAREIFHDGRFFSFAGLDLKSLGAQARSLRFYSTGIFEIQFALGL